MADKYIKLDQRSHVLKRPNMYIGSIEEDNYNTYVFNEEEKKILKQDIKFIPGLYKIFDEILVNAIDHITRLKEKESEYLVKNIKIEIDRDTNVITITNDGEGIEVEKHSEYNIYIPELIFGHLLTSSNYDDTQERTIGGLNGIGAKAVSIFSSYFKVITVDYKNKLKYTQLFENNLSKINKPTITKYTRKPFTTIEFKPDYEKFKLEGLTDDMYNIMLKRVYDACAITDNDINIYFNNSKIEYKNFEKYSTIYIDNEKKVYEKINDRWEIIVSINTDNTGFKQISFVNGIWTIKGGKHVDCIINQITKKLNELITKKNKNINITTKMIKDSIILFVKCIIPNPTFDSQSKETLTTPLSKIKVEVDDKVIEKIYKLGIIDKIIEFSNIQNNKLSQKTDGKKKSTIKGLPDLEDANWAGTSKSSECTLILTEGLSAASMAISGISVVGKEKYGVFPLRGKVLNVKDISDKKIIDNIEITNIKKILGLQSGKNYDDKTKQELRYNKVMLLVDADYDGSHIKGLLFNVFHTLWPSLIKNNGFLISMLTPIVKAKKGNNVLQFYNTADYDEWKEKTDIKSWNIKYYKGLGTSDNKEAKEYFKEMKKIEYKWTDESNESIELAFNKKRADDRKIWLSNYDKNKILDYDAKEVTYNDFINKDLIHFSNYDIERSIPNMMDGMKTSQRKVLYSCFKRNLIDKEIRVSQLAAYVSENTSYHHGEASLQSTIVGMAQDFVGSNNINLIMPIGQFGCLDPETNIYTKNLRIKKAKDIIIGDELIGDDGTFRKVLKTISGIDDMYKIKIKINDICNDSIIINKEHILTLSYKKNKIIEWNEETQFYEYSYFDTKSFKIIHSKILNYTDNTEELIKIKLSHIPEIFDIKLIDFLEKFNNNLNDFRCIKNYNVINWPYKEVKYNPYDLGNNIIVNQYIPEEYIINDKSIRLEFLAGVIDKIGEIKYEYYKPYILLPKNKLTTHALRMIKIICATLGYNALFGKKQLTIMGINLDNIPLRKIDNKIYYFKNSHYEDYKYEFEIENIGKGKFCGWSLDGNERFLLSNFIVTHNSRIHGGKDAGQSRYIHTMLSKDCINIFKKEDKNILNYLNDDGVSIEPEFYIPTIPMILVNGALGIATGFSTNIPCFDPNDIVNVLKMLINNENVDDYELKPWYKGFKGEIFKLNDKYYSKGIYKKIKTKVLITELPIGVWIYDYKCHLEEILDPTNNKYDCNFKSYENNSDDININITLVFNNEDKLNDNFYTTDNNGFTKFENQFKMITSKPLSMTNMYAFNENCQIQKFNNPIDIIKQFYNVRLTYYQKRKDYICENITNQLLILNNKIRFMTDIIEEKIIVHKIKKTELEEYLENNDYNKINNNYDYIIKIPIYNFTIDKIENLKIERDNLYKEFDIIKNKKIQHMWDEELLKFDTQKIDIKQKKKVTKKI